MKLEDNDIKKIDLFLAQNGIKYLDVRYELMDHLISEFENDSKFAFLEDFLHSKRFFIKEVLKQKRKTVHWAYQRKLWVRLASFFKNPIYLISTILLFVLMSWLCANLTESGLKIALSIAIILPASASLLLYIISSSKHRKLIQGDYLFGIMGLPNMFMYIVPILKDILIEYPLLVSFYWWFAIMLNVAGLVEFVITRKKIITQYNTLKTI